MQFELNQVYHFTMPQGTISDSGISAIKSFLYNQNLNEGDWLTQNPNPLYQILPTLPIDFDWSWVTREGKLPKRIAKFYHGLRLKMPVSIMEQIGNLAKANYLPAETFHFDFVNRFNWSAGNFGDYGSCYWWSRSQSRQVLEDNGAFAVRFFTTENRGYARAWLVMVEDFAIIFNGYGMSSQQIANILGAFWSKPYRQIYLSNYGEQSGVIYINGGIGYTIGTTEHSSYDLEFYTPCSETCYNCDECVHEDDVYFGANDMPYCQECHDELFDSCERCGESCWRDSTHFVNDELYCPRCYTRNCFQCASCDEDYLTSDSHSHQGRLYCSDCYTQVATPEPKPK